MKTEISEKTPAKIVSPAQGPAKPKETRVNVHPNARGQMPSQVQTVHSGVVDSALLQESQASATINTEDETLGEFVGKHAAAQAQTQEWVETSKKNMNSLMEPKKWEHIGYFCYKGVKVCPFGKTEEIELAQSKTVHDRMHPEAKTTVISG